MCSGLFILSKKITVIGGSGFVGTNLCRQLQLKQQDFEIIDVKVSNEFPDKCKVGDVRDIQSLRDAISGDLIINLAAVHRDNIPDTSEYHRTNVDGAKNIISVCSEMGIHKIIFTSTVAVYGFAIPGTDETGIIKPFNKYGQTKFDAEEHFRSWQREGNNSLIIVRPTVIFGEGNRGNVFNLLNQIALGRFVMIGRGENKKSMAYIGNVVAFLEACIETNQRYGLYNYVDIPNLKMSELVELVRNKLHNKMGTGFQVPYLLALFFGNLADLVSIIVKRNFLISSIRVKKFASSTEFLSLKANLNDFQAPYELEEGLLRTLESEFISPSPDREIFFTE